MSKEARRGEARREVLCGDVVREASEVQISEQCRLPARARVVSRVAHSGGGGDDGDDGGDGGDDRDDDDRGCVLGACWVRCT